MTYDAVNYNNASKNMWRVRAWSAIRDFVPNPASALVLYFAGENDRDMFVARRKGFSPHNMIAIELNSKVAEKLRAKKRTVIAKDLLSVMLDWNPARPVSVVFADLQHGLTEQATAILMAWTTLEAFRGGVLVMNMQRGRESIADESYFQISYARETFTNFQGSNNRAQLLMLAHLSFIARKIGIKPLTRENLLKELGELFNWHFFDSYRSTPKSPMFDSLILIDKGRIPRFKDKSVLEKWSTTAECPCPSLHDVVLKSDVKQQIAAALAVRRMRIDGTLAS